MKVIIMVCNKKKTVQDKWTTLWLKIAHLDNSGLAQRILLKFYRMKGANRYMKISLIFKKKFHLGQFDLFSLEAIFYLLIGHGWNWVRWLLRYILKQAVPNYFHDYCWILKQSRHDFSGKHLYDEYCIDIMCCLCVEVKIIGLVKLL